MAKADRRLCPNDVTEWESSSRFVRKERKQQNNICESDGIDEEMFSLVVFQLSAAHFGMPMKTNL